MYIFGSGNKVKKNYLAPNELITKLFNACNITKILRWLWHSRRNILQDSIPARISNNWTECGGTEFLGHSHRQFFGAQELGSDAFWATLTTATILQQITNFYWAPRCSGVAVYAIARCWMFERSFMLFRVLSCIFCLETTWTLRPNFTDMAAVMFKSSVKSISRGKTPDSRGQNFKNFIALFNLSVTKARKPVSLSAVILWNSY